MSEQTTPRRTQAERTQQRKEQLIREAMRFFAQDGFRGAKLADIARAAGVTEPGLLHHFPKKEQLLMEVLAERDRIDQERFDLFLHTETGDTLTSFQKMVEYNETVPGLVQLFTVLVAESIVEQHPGHEYFMQRYQTARAQNMEILSQAQARGEIRGDISSEDLGIMLFAMMDGLQIQWLYEPEKVDMGRIFEQFVRLLRAN
jgi:AcrR family transcriptional regulator